MPREIVISTSTEGTVYLVRKGDNGPGLRASDGICGVHRTANGRDHYGVSAQGMRDQGYRIVVGLTADRSRRGGYTATIRTDQGYLTPTDGTHDIDLAARFNRGELTADQLIEMGWLDIFELNDGRLAWPIAEDRAQWPASTSWWREPKRGYHELTIFGERWTMHTSTAGLRELLGRMYDDQFELSVDYGSQSLDILVPDEVHAWEQQADQLASVMHLKRVSFDYL